MTRRARLYTEMVTADAVVFGRRERLIGFDAEQHPIALQLGGSEPGRLAEAARIGAGFGYDEINLNCGCPSDRVRSGRFGACLMLSPCWFSECVAAMVAAVDVPVSVKCRIGVDEQEPREALDAFAEAVKAAGAAALIVHARKALLEGLSPKDNRSIRRSTTASSMRSSALIRIGRSSSTAALRTLRPLARILSMSTASCWGAPPIRTRSS